MTVVSENVRTWFLVLALIGLWFPPSFWIAIVIVLVSFGSELPGLLYYIV